MLLRSDVLSNQSFTSKVTFELVYDLRAMLRLQCLQCIKPHIGHFLSKAKSVRAVGCNVRSLLSNKRNIFWTDNPHFSFSVPRNLDIFAICFESLDDFNLMTFQNSFERASQNVILVHVRFVVKTGIIVPLFWRYMLVSQIKKFLKAFASKRIFKSILYLVFENCVASSDIFNKHWERWINLIFNRSKHVQLQIYHLYRFDCTAEVPICFDNVDSV